jgi:ERF superfamily protein
MTALEEPPGEIVVTPKTLAQKLVEVALSLDSIAKEGFNRAQNYKYASAETLIGDVRRPLLERGVLVLAGEAVTDERPRTTAKGAETSITTVHLAFTFMDAETGETIELPWLGRGEDPMDKGVGKALTNALKTFLRQQLLLPWGDDPEADEGSDERAGRGGSDTVNLIEQARGLSNAQLNAALVKAGLPAAEKPFGAFTRIPAEYAANVRAALEEERG